VNGDCRQTDATTPAACSRRLANQTRVPGFRYVPYARPRQQARRLPHLTSTRQNNDGYALATRAVPRAITISWCRVETDEDAELNLVADVPPRPALSPPGDILEHSDGALGGVRLAYRPGPVIVAVEHAA
jgi:hypothetical protein